MPIDFQNDCRCNNSLLVYIFSYLMKFNKLFPVHSPRLFQGQRMHLLQIQHHRTNDQVVQKCVRNS